MNNFAHAHPYELLGIAWVFVVIVSNMPAPKSGGFTNGLLYAWIWGSLHAISGTVGRLLQEYAPKLTFPAAPPPDAKVAP
jgi:hypothetical protein